LVAYPWLRDQAPALNTLAERLPADADVLYLHDLALHPGARGRGLTSPVIEQVVRLAQTEGLPAVSLVAVNDATAFWRLRGFEDAPSPTMATKLASYGSDAAYMIRSLV
jgi:GNAT superfamily N-acetyltransferase